MPADDKTDATQADLMYALASTMKAYRTMTNWERDAMPTKMRIEFSDMCENFLSLMVNAETGAHEELETCKALHFPFSTKVYGIQDNGAEQLIMHDVYRRASEPPTKGELPDAR